MLETDENWPAPADIKHPNHIEVEEFLCKEKSKGRVFGENLLHVLADTSRAIDDSYGIISAIVASISTAIIKLPLLLLSIFLSLGYFISKKERRDKKNAYITKEELISICDETITPAHYLLWKKKLTSIGAQQFYDERGEEITLENFLRRNKTQGILKQIEASFESIVLLKNKFARRVQTAEGANLKQYQLRLQFIFNQLKLKAKDHVSKLHNPDLTAHLYALTEEYHDNQPLKKTAWYYFKLGFIWLRDNYKKILIGITLAATFGSLLVLLFGMSLLTFPLNVIIAVSLALIVSACFIIYKQYFNYVSRTLGVTRRSFTNNFQDKGQLMSLLVESRIILNQVKSTIEDYDNRLKAMPQKIRDEDEAEDVLMEHVEVKDLREKPSRWRYFLNYLIPSLLAINAGYSIGATLLQLSLIAGISAPIMPFIFLGISFAIIYLFHRIYQSFQENLSEKNRMDELNHLVITRAKISSWENRLRLINKDGLRLKNEIVSAQVFIKSNMIQDIGNDLKKIHRKLKKICQQQVSLPLNNILENLNAIMVSEIATLKSTDRKEIFYEQFNLHYDKPALKINTVETPPVVQSGWKRFTLRAFQLFKEYLKPLTQGLGFGLSAGASLIIFLIGASTLVTLPTSIGILFCGAIIGITISLINKLVENRRAVHINEANNVEIALQDKETMMDVYMQANEALFQAKKLVGASQPKKYVGFGNEEAMKYAQDFGLSSSEEDDNSDDSTQALLGMDVEEDAFFNKRPSLVKRKNTFTSPRTGEVDTGQSPRGGVEFY